MDFFCAPRLIATVLILTVNASLVKADWTDHAKSLVATAAANKASSVLSNYLVEALIKPCREELGQFNPIVIYNCDLASKSFGKVLDIKIATDGGLLVYSSEMARLMASPETLTYLRDLVTYYKSNSDTPSDVYTNRRNFWEWTMAHSASHGSTAMALRLIAILFQDPTSGYGDGYVGISLNQSGLNYYPDEAHILLTEAITIVKSRLLPPSDLKMDAEGLNIEKLYHFYVIAYAAYKITKDTKDPRYGFLLPFLMNRGYEFISIRLREVQKAYSKERPNTTPSTFELLGYFFNPPPVNSEDLRKNFDSVALGDAVHDIYLGYRGAMFGASLGAGKRLPTLTRAEFEAAFLRSPFEFTSLAMSLIENTH